MKNFAMTGVGGFVARRHLEAIRDTGNRLVAALDPHDSVGILDGFFPKTSFFTEFERFDRHLEKLRRGPAKGRVDVLSICSPNHLHDAHIRLALRIGADAICEKPLVINPWNLDALQELEATSEGGVSVILQLRHHPELLRLKRRIDRERPGVRHRVTLSSITGRGLWYRYSWKGSPERSGGLIVNIGIHFFDLLLWIFGDVRRFQVGLLEPTRAAGVLELERADVRWFLSIDPADCPEPWAPGRMSSKSITVDGEEISLSGDAGALHTRAYEAALAGEGIGIDEARPAIELVHALRSAVPTGEDLSFDPRAAAGRNRGGT